MKYTDEEIIEGFCSFDKYITKQYFYAYCRRAYNIYDYKYQLRNKTGLDFYSLAHEYYIQLLKYNFKPLLDKPGNMKLSYWMVRGFRFVVLDALKAYNKEFENQAVESADAVLDYVRSANSEEHLLPQVAAAVEAHYNDRIMHEIAHLVFYEGFKQKEVAEQLGLTPSAVNQRYKKMMSEVVTPFVIENYGKGSRYTNDIALSAINEERCFGCMPSDILFDFSEVMCEPNDNNYEQKYKEMEKRITPYVTSLKENEVFVFGSNLQGIHAGGAARIARMKFGAVMGNGVGLQGQSYAIPTMQGDVETIKPYVDEFITFATKHPEMTFLVTPIGCGIAGFEPKDIAPLFVAAKDIKNIYLPESFWKIIID